MKTYKNKFLATLLGVSLLVLGACDKREDTKPAAAAAPSNQMTVLAGSELKDVETGLKADILAATGVELKFTYTGTLDAIERLAVGEKFDAVWVSHGKYMAMNESLKGRIKASEKTMLSPVVLGVKASKAKALGWDKGEPTWKDIADAAKAGKFTFGMTNPTASNTGLTAVIGLASALAKSPDTLTAEDMKNPRLADFFKGQTLTSGSSGWLADAFVRDQAKVDGIINYESVLLSLDAGGKLTEQLVLVYPKEGIVTADYPLMLLEADKRADYDKLVTYIRSAPFQTKMSAATLRRPVNADATPAPAIAQRTLIELPFPGQPEIIDELLGNFLADTRIPATSRYVLDVSGSMKGERLAAMKAAMATLASESATGPQRFARFQNREDIGVIAFSSEPQPTKYFKMGTTPAENAAARGAVLEYVNGLQVDGGTAIYSSVQRTLEEMAVERANAKDKRYYTVVLMTDGENTNGLSVDKFAKWYAAQDENLKSIRVFCVLFGEGSPKELGQLAKMTGGQVFDAKSKPLVAVFKEIRGYQ